jgi:ABC-type Zn uptake system ZnuABC Zn-binding protein ZnuA
MPENERKPTGGRMSDKRFGESPNSIASNLRSLSPELQAKYRENRIKYAGDAAHMDSWASQGFSSMPVEEYEDRTVGHD